MHTIWIRLTTLLAVGIAALAFVGCGSSKQNNPITVQVVVSFPKRQSLGQSLPFKLTVRNADKRPIANLAITINSFSMRSQQPEVADPNRPVWIVDQQPNAGEVTYNNTWSFGRLSAGQIKTLVWKVTPVVTGSHPIHYSISTTLSGPLAKTPQGMNASGVIDIKID